MFLAQMCPAGSFYYVKPRLARGVGGDGPFRGLTTGLDGAKIFLALWGLSFRHGLEIAQAL
jgi:hypothetical protein